MSEAAGGFCGVTRTCFLHPPASAPEAEVRVCTFVEPKTVKRERESDGNIFPTSVSPGKSGVLGFWLLGAEDGGPPLDPSRGFRDVV